MEKLAMHDQEVAEKVDEGYEDCGDGVECGCCFSTYPVRKFPVQIQYPEAYLF
jgi:TRIAD3 protein (E3 ubiquitin-protein ligase RNF216)